MSFFRETKVLAATLGALGCLALLAQAQDGSAVFRSDSPLVVLHATVTDQAGKLVTGLPKSAFHVYENGKEQQLKIFRQEDVPVSLGLVVDDSASMLDKRDRVKSASLALVRASHPDDEVFIVNFNDRPYLDTDFTSNIGTLEEGLRHFESRGTTALRDAVRLSVEHLKRKGREDKKVLLVITDGEDNNSAYDLPSLVRSAQQEGVMVYAVGILGDASTREAERARRDLDALTNATGGQAYYLDDVSQVESIARVIAHDIRNQYTIAYTPSNEALDGSYRSIRVTVQGTQPVTVRTRTGYYAVPERQSEMRVSEWNRPAPVQPGQ